MNKKYLQSIALIVFLGSMNPIFSGNNESDNGVSSSTVAAIVGIGVVIGFIIGDATIYTIYPSLSSTGKMVASKYEDVSSETQEWAHKVLQKSKIKDADQIPLKKGKEGQGWEAFDRHFIVVRHGFDPAKCSRQKCLEDEFFLKHETKHVQNNDALKERAHKVITKPMIFNGQSAHMDYLRYQEIEADRFAYEHATSKEELEAMKKFFENLGKSINVAEGRKDYHPSCRYRAAIAQYYINKWDAEHKKA